MTEELLQTGLAKVKSIHRVDAIRKSPGVRRKLIEVIESLPGWRKGVCQKKTETPKDCREIRATGSTFRRVNRSYPGIRATELPKPMGEPPVPRFFGYDWILALILKPI
ncbi:hypothetical protein B296_00034345 [Ensete ventricosum]|uniref:Uncharacterized protein n=1 Tax=Ensete ventricosum TaxID=4639 RepID=A0A426XBE3_ENSVE|nr:hypothetical protein B296_00034345 [Ensete ventricosum]